MAKGESSMSTVNSNHSPRKLPDFLIIGAQRSGTSWLNKNLRPHPEIWLTPIKELHHFNTDRKTNAKRRQRFIKHLRRLFLRMVRQTATLDKQLLKDLAWDGHYLLRERTNEWYVKLFRPEPGQIAGEATPAYGTLSREKIQEIQQINPEMKLIYIMRDPIERSWSGATKDLAKRKKRMLTEVPDEEIYAKLGLKGAMLRSNHLQALDTWQSVFPPEQLLIAFFEDIAEKPEELLLRVYQFLGITRSEKYISPNVRIKVNPAGIYKTPIPERFHIFLAKQQIDQLRELNRRFGGPAAEWLRKAELILEERKDNSGGRPEDEGN
jgi:hypothetical protein